MILRLWSLIDHWLFSGVSQGNGLVARLVRMSRYPYAVLRDLASGQLNLRAMVLVYSTLLSVIPLLAFSFAILKAFNVYRELEPLIHELVRPVEGVSSAEFTQKIFDFAENVQAGLVGSVGFALLLWTLIGMVKKLEDSLNYVWRVQVPRSFARRIAEYAGLLIVGPALVVAVVGLSKLAFDSTALRALGDVPAVVRFSHTLLVLSPYAIVVSIFTALYMLIPNTRVHFRPALIGAFTAGVLWAATGKLFTALVLYTTRLTILYAGFAFVVAALVFTYLGWLILLAGAQLSFYVQNPSYLRVGAQQLRLSGREMERLALAVMYMVGKAHAGSGSQWSVDALARELGLPGVLVAEVVDMLCAARLIVESEDELLFPGRDSGAIALTDILDAVRLRGSGHPMLRVRALPPVDRLYASIEAAWREPCSDRTLRDLLETPDDAPG